MNQSSFELLLLRRHDNQLEATLDILNRHFYYNRSIFTHFSKGQWYMLSIDYVKEDKMHKFFTYLPIFTVC
jgi:hypothetical protein